jgi:transposase-like protein
MAKLRTRHSAQHKFKLALEAAKEQKTINELASQHKVHPNQISQWKSLLLEEGPGLFNGQALSRQHKTQQVRETQLYEQIGRLQMELEWLKKKGGDHSD